MKSIALMRRTQIYLQDELYDSLKTRARSMGVSMSELIRRTLDADIQKDPVADARAYFECLKPLQSFAKVNAESYVRCIRSKNRISRADATWDALQGTD
jgi:negative regulator of replication initiation